ncbi:nitronate monooxygenase (plasmid) [Cupriavidus sp. P-10]|uniref:NAD(P)H-dependent flavin oxidoreductase n=1 Tax=Cupriavidus sp. P-10 TaxID=2027911 RepID=UPI000E2F0B15|nr:nitronate monooxygenase family protein [Cupriavidus sp. P-10]BDB29052.1 nitronate monooxygenase [Cupriavidus sp. P-10]
MKTRLTELLGIRYPIVKGGMQWIGRARLAAAVSNAGALGMVTARTQATPDELRREIERTRELTGKPFGVNLTLSFAAKGVTYDDWVAAIVDSGVKIVETAGNNPRPVIDAFKSAGVTVIHKCTSVRHAQAAERLGVDVISIDSFEAAGHIGDGDVGSMVMIPATVRAVKIPVIASGGIWGGRAMAAALVLGAEGVNVGTRFTLTQECDTHENVKQTLIKGSELDSILIKRTLGHTARYFRTVVSDEVLAMEHRPGGATYKDLAHLLAGPRGRQALESGDMTAGLICASQAVALIDDIPTCEELVARMVAECRSAVQASLGRFAA